MAIKRLGAQRFSGVEADVSSLPIDADLIGAIFDSTDTLKFWIFNGTVWNESAGGGGGITGLNPNSTILDHSTTLDDYTSPATASATSEDGANVAANAVDESTATFWKSNAGINESISIDMGSVLNDFALAIYIDKAQTGITETQFQIKTLELTGFDLTDLKAYYKFDVLSGDIVNLADSVGSTDSLGSDVDMVNSGATYGAAGILDNALSFDGSNDFGTLVNGGSDLFNFFTITDATWSVSCWVFYDDLGGGHIISSAPVGDTTMFQINLNTSTQVALQAVGTGSTFIINTSWTVATLSTGVWIHMVFTGDQSLASDGLELWLDGVSQGTKNRSSNSGSAGTQAEPMHVATHGAIGSVFFAGRFDELSLWSRVLTDSEVASLYNAGNALALSQATQTPQTLRTINVVDLVDQQYNFIRFNGVNAQTLQIEGSSGSSLVMAANDLQVLVESDPPLVTAHGQFTINGTNEDLALNGGDPTSSVIADPSTNSMTLNSTVEQSDPPTDGMVMWNEILDANNSVSHSKMKIDGAIKNVRWF